MKGFVIIIFLFTYVLGAPRWESEVQSPTDLKNDQKIQNKFNPEWQVSLQYNHLHNKDLINFDKNPVIIKDASLIESLPIEILKRSKRGKKVYKYEGKKCNEDDDDSSDSSSSSSSSCSSSSCEDKKDKKEKKREKKEEKKRRKQEKKEEKKRRKEEKRKHDKESSKESKSKESSTWISDKLSDDAFINRSIELLKHLLSSLKNKFSEENTDDQQFKDEETTTVQSECEDDDTKCKKDNDSDESKPTENRWSELKTMIIKNLIQERLRNRAEFWRNKDFWNSSLIDRTLERLRNRVYHKYSNSTLKDFPVNVQAVINTINYYLIISRARSNSVPSVVVPAQNKPSGLSNTDNKNNQPSPGTNGFHGIPWLNPLLPFQGIGQVHVPKPAQGENPQVPDSSLTQPPAASQPNKLHISVPIGGTHVLIPVKNSGNILQYRPQFHINEGKLPTYPADVDSTGNSQTQPVLPDEGTQSGNTDYDHTWQGPLILPNVPTTENTENVQKSDVKPDGTLPPKMKSEEDTQATVSELPIFISQSNVNGSPQAIQPATGESINVQQSVSIDNVDDSESSLSSNSKDVRSGNNEFNSSTNINNNNQSGQKGTKTTDDASERTGDDSTVTNNQKSDSNYAVNIPQKDSGNESVLMPTESEESSTSDVPLNQNESDKSEQPTNSEKPDESEAPNNSDVTVDSNQPQSPVASDRPDQSTEVTSEQPIESEKPEASNNPDVTVDSNQTESPVASDRPDQSAEVTSEQPADSAKSEESEAPNNSDVTVDSNQTESPIASDRPDQSAEVTSEQPADSAKSEESEAPNNSDVTVDSNQPESPVASDRPDQSAEVTSEQPADSEKPEASNNSDVTVDSNGTEMPAGPDWLEPSVGSTESELPLTGEPAADTDTGITSNDVLNDSGIVDGTMNPTVIDKFPESGLEEPDSTSPKGDENSTDNLIKNDELPNTINDIDVTSQSFEQDDGNSYLTVTPCLLDHSSIPAIVNGQSDSTSKAEDLTYTGVPVETLAPDLKSTTGASEPVPSTMGPNYTEVTLDLNTEDMNEDVKTDEGINTTVKKELSTSGPLFSSETTALYSTGDDSQLNNTERPAILTSPSTLLNDTLNTENTLNGDELTVTNQSENKVVKSNDAANIDKGSKKVTNNSSNASVSNEESESVVETMITTESTVNFVPIDSTVTSIPQHDDSEITTVRVEPNTALNSNNDLDITTTEIILPTTEYKTLKTLNVEEGLPGDLISLSGTDNPSGVIEKRTLNTGTTTESTTVDDSTIDEKLVTNSSSHVEATNTSNVSSETQAPLIPIIITYADGTNVTKTIDITNSSQLKELLDDIYRFLQ